MYTSTHVSSVICLSHHAVILYCECCVYNLYCTIPVSLEVTLHLHVGVSVYVTGQIIY